MNLQLSFVVHVRQRTWLCAGTRFMNGLTQSDKSGESFAREIFITKMSTRTFFFGGRLILSACFLCGHLSFALIASVRESE